MTSNSNNNKREKPRGLDEEILEQLDEISGGLLDELQEDSRLSSGVPEAQRGNDLEFIQMSGLTRPATANGDLVDPFRDFIEEDTHMERPDTDVSRPVSFYEKGVADVDSEMTPGSLEPIASFPREPAPLTTEDEPSSSDFTPVEEDRTPVVEPSGQPEIPEHSPIANLREIVDELSRRKDPALAQEPALQADSLDEFALSEAAEELRATEPPAEVGASLSMSFASAEPVVELSSLESEPAIPIERPVEQRVAKPAPVEFDMMSSLPDLGIAESSALAPTAPIPKPADAFAQKPPPVELEMMAAPAESEDAKPSTPEPSLAQPPTPSPMPGYPPPGRPVPVEFDMMASLSESSGAEEPEAESPPPSPVPVDVPAQKSVPIDFGVTPPSSLAEAERLLEELEAQPRESEALAAVAASSETLLVGTALSGRNLAEHHANAGQDQPVVTAGTSAAEGAPEDDAEYEPDESIYRRPYGHRRGRRHGHIDRNKRSAVRWFVAIVVILAALVAGYQAYDFFQARFSSPARLLEDAADLASQGKHERAANAYLTFATIFPESPQRETALFDAAFEFCAVPESSPNAKSSYEQGLQLLDNFVKEFPGSTPRVARAETLRGVASYRLGRYKEAIAILSNPELRLRDPMAALPALRTLARAYVALKDYESARKAFLQAAELPENTSPDADHQELGNIYRTLCAQAADAAERQRYAEMAIEQWQLAAAVPSVDPTRKNELAIQVEALQQNIGRTAPPTAPTSETPAAETPSSEPSAAETPSGEPSAAETPLTEAPDGGTASGAPVTVPAAPAGDANASKPEAVQQDRGQKPQQPSEDSGAQAGQAKSTKPESESIQKPESKKTQQPESAPSEDNGPEK